MNDVITQRRRQCQRARELKRGAAAFEDTPAEWDEERELNFAIENTVPEFWQDRSCYDEMVSEHLYRDANFLDALHRIMTEPDVQDRDIYEIRQAILIAASEMAAEWLDTPD